jgi:hypothetical protein
MKSNKIFIVLFAFGYVSSSGATSPSGNEFLTHPALHQISNPSLLELDSLLLMISLSFTLYF